MINTIKMYVARWSTTEPNEISSDIYNRRTLHRQAKQREQKLVLKYLRKKTLSQKHEDQEH